MTVLECIRSLTGVDCKALPLTACTVRRPYLLEKYGIFTSGTAVFFAVPYVMSRDAYDPERNVSLYAVPRDYHLYVRELSETLIPALCAQFASHRFALFADHSPVLEVEAAAKAGLGMIGLNRLLITPDYGSFVFLCEVITDAGWTETTGLPESAIPTGDAPTCERCGACLAACPITCGASGGMETCLSALTQKKGELTPEEAERLATHPLVWGCDTCQLACPHNRRVLRMGNDTPLPFFRNHRTVHLTADAVSAMSDQDFSARAYAWRGRGVILRNLRIKEGAPDSKTLPGTGNPDKNES